MFIACILKKCKVFGTYSGSACCQDWGSWGSWGSGSRSFWEPVWRNLSFHCFLAFQSCYKAESQLPRGPLSLTWVLRWADSVDLHLPQCQRWPVYVGIVQFPVWAFFTPAEVGPGTPNPWMSMAQKWLDEDQRFSSCQKLSLVWLPVSAFKNVVRSYVVQVSC